MIVLGVVANAISLVFCFILVSIDCIKLAASPLPPSPKIGELFEITFESCSKSLLEILNFVGLSSS